MAKPTVTELKRALAAAAKADASRTDRARVADPARQLAKRRALDERLAARFAAAGLDLKGLARDGADAIRDARRETEKAETDAAKRSSKVAETLRTAAESRLAALRYTRSGLTLPAAPLVTTLDTPVLIWATWSPIVPQHAGIIWDSAIEAGHSWAKIKVVAEGGDLTDRLSFYYLWENESDYHSLINVSTYMSMFGFCRAHGDGSFSTWFNNSTESWLNVSAEISLKNWSAQPPTVIPYVPSPEQHHTQLVTSLTVSGNYYEKNANKTIINGFNTNQDLVIIPPHTVVVIEAILSLYHKVENGHVLADFASEDYKVSSHYVQVAQLSAPALTGTPVAPAGMFG